MATNCTTPNQLPASLLADWYSNDPKRMLAALRRIGVSEEKLFVWAKHCDIGAGWGGSVEPEWWLRNWQLNLGSFSHGIPYLHCMFGGEFAVEWEECGSCLIQADDGKMYSSGYHRYKDFDDGRQNFSDTAPCSYCLGLGVVRSTVECSACFGNGTVEKELKLGCTTQGMMSRCNACGGKCRIPKPIIDPRWRTSTVLDLVRKVRGESQWPAGGDWTVTSPQFDLLPILADALEDVGCDNEELLTHCRSGGPHVVGECWVMRELDTHPNG